MKLSSCSRADRKESPNGIDGATRRGNPRPQRGRPQRGQPQRGQPQRGRPHRGQPPRGQPQRGRPQWADLRGADLSGADLSEANLSEANLDGANLSDANLGGADLGGPTSAGPTSAAADLSGADLGEAALQAQAQRRQPQRRLSAASTSSPTSIYPKANGLDSVIHIGPSTIGIDTLFRSKGKIPEAFLRGCGVPETVIDSVAFPDRLDEPIQFYSCFISYSTKDEEFAEAAARSNGPGEGFRVWFAPEDIQGGKKLHEQIDRAIQVHDDCCWFSPKHSMNSEWVRHEIRAGAQGRTQGANEGSSSRFGSWTSRPSRLGMFRRGSR